MEPQPDPRRRPQPGLTVCSLCVGETLDGVDPRTGGQLERLRTLEREGTTRLTLVECLDMCERGDVVVVRPTRQGRARGGRPTWFERLAGPEATSALSGWLAAGGPGLAPVPAALDTYLVEGTAEPEPVP